MCTDTAVPKTTYLARKIKENALKGEGFFVFFCPGGRRNDAETAARVIAAAVSRSVLKHAFTVNQSGVPQLFAACSAAPQD